LYNPYKANKFKSSEEWKNYYMKLYIIN
jgi:hypothetical protein